MEIAWVWAYPVARKDIGDLEDALFHKFHEQSALMNGKIPPVRARQIRIPKPTQVVQVMSNEEIAEKRNHPDLRLPRQAEHYSQIVGHFLAVKNSPEIALAIRAHFQRLEKYHRQLLGIQTEDVEDDEPDE